MNKRMAAALKDSKQISFDDSDKFVIMSDCHRGDGSHSDNFANNQHLYFSALTGYYNEGFSYIELGDGDELWENRSFCDISAEHSHVFWLLRKFFTENRLHFIYGNHDMDKKNSKWVSANFYECLDERTNKKVPMFPNARIYESIILEKGESKKIILVHGHQGDIMNDRFWRINRWLVRYLWKPLEIFGVNDPTGAAKNYKNRNRIEKRLYNWAHENREILIAGHTHRPVFPKPGEVGYFNSGSCVHPRCITAVEIEKGQITLVKWSVLTRRDGVLAVFRDILDGPIPLDDYFAEI